MQLPHHWATSAYGIGAEGPIRTANFHVSVRIDSFFTLYTFKQLNFNKNAECLRHRHY